MTRTTFFSIGLPSLLLLGVGVFAVTGCVDGDSTGAKSEVTVSFKSGGGTDDDDEVVTIERGAPGLLAGRFTIDGSFSTLPPQIPKGTSGKDPEFCGKELDIPDERLIVQDGGVANVVIYMDKVAKDLREPNGPTEPVVFDQKNCTFFPHVLLVRTGQPVHVWNSDGAAHNTHTYPGKNTGF